MKRSVGFVILFIAGIAFVIWANREQGSAVIKADFKTKVLAEAECSAEEMDYLRGLADRFHDEIYAKHVAANTVTLDDQNAYIRDMLASMREVAEGDGKLVLADRLQSLETTYRP